MKFEAMDEICEKCLEVIFREPKKSFDSESFVHIPIEILTDIVCEDEFQVSEIYLFERLVHWQLHNISTGKVDEASVKDLFRHVRYPLISSKDLVRIVAPTKLAPLDLYVAALEFNADVRRLCLLL